MDLSDITVLDLTWLLPGPYGSMLLSDLGAEVIKIEEPSSGDIARWRRPSVEATGYGAMYHSVNRNKRSVAIDLKSDLGRRAFLRLAETADVVFEQFRPGVVDRLGVGYEDVRAVNEDIVYCSLSGYGQDGALRDRTGHNTNYLAMAGLLEATKSRDGTVPAIPSYPMADMVSGVFSAFTILAALRDRDAGNGGEHLDVSITDVMFSMATGQEWRVSMSDRLSEDERSMDNRDEPNLGVYETKDGAYVTISCRDEKFWNQLLAEIGREDLKEYHLATDEKGRYAVSELQGEFEKRTREEWEELLSDEVPFAPVHRFAECFTMQHFVSRALVSSFPPDREDPLQYIGFPAKSSKEIDDLRSPAPELGEHTVEVLEQVLSNEELDELKAEGAI